MNHTVTQIKREARAFSEQAPLFGPYLAYCGLTCKYFGQSQEADIESTKTTNSIVVIGTTGDLATPYEWAQGLKKAANQFSTGIPYWRRPYRPGPGQHLHRQPD